MTTITFTIDDEVKARLDALASRHGLNTAALVREALLDKLEELEDHDVVKERLGRPYRTVSHEEIRKGLGLED
jgi:predicted DNA-binding protein